MKNRLSLTQVGKNRLHSTLMTLSLLLASFAFSSNATASILELKWLDLVPESERIAREMMSQQLEYGDDAYDADMQSEFGAVRHELSGKQVRIPGFVIPLEGDAEEVTEFLLVPYYGSCIHTPPPPPNQIIHVSFPEGAPDQELWDVIYLEGKLMTEQNMVGMIQTGYHIIGSNITPYE